MDKEEMLRKSGLTPHQYHELVRKFQEFLTRLEPEELAAVRRWMPSADQIVQAFDSGLTREQLAAIVNADPTSSTSISERGVGLSVHNPPPPPPPNL